MARSGPAGSTVAARIARNNGPSSPMVDAELVRDWNGNPIGAGAAVIVDDENPLVVAAVASGLIELDPALGRHLRWRDKPEAPTP